MTPKEFAQLWYAGSPSDDEETELRINGLARLIDQHFVARSRLSYINENETLTQAAYYLDPEESESEA